MMQHMRTLGRLCLATVVMLAIGVGSAAAASNDQVSAEIKKGTLVVEGTDAGEEIVLANSYHNQFELPVLFYAIVALALITRKADLVFVLLSWVFVVSRLVHAFIHATSNRVSQRFFVFLIGAIVLMIMWIVFALRIFAAEAGI